MKEQRQGRKRPSFWSRALNAERLSLLNERFAQGLTSSKNKRLKHLQKIQQQWLKENQNFPPTEVRRIQRLCAKLHVSS